MEISWENHGEINCKWRFHGYLMGSNGISWNINGSVVFLPIDGFNGKPCFFYIGWMHFGSDISCSGEGVIRQLPCRLPSSRLCHVTNAPLSPAHDVAHPDAVQQNIAQPGDSRGTWP